MVKLKKATKLIHLRNVASITLQNSTLLFHYNFPHVRGETYYGGVESRPAFDEFTWTTEAEAVEAFEECKKAFQELR